MSESQQAFNVVIIYFFIVAALVIACIILGGIIYRHSDRYKQLKHTEPVRVYGRWN